MQKVGTDRVRKLRNLDSNNIYTMLPAIEPRKDQVASVTDLSKSRRGGTRGGQGHSRQAKANTITYQVLALRRSPPLRAIIIHQVIFCHQSPAGRAPTIPRDIVDLLR